MDYIYMPDFCKIIDYFINNDTHEKVYNLGGAKCELVDLAEKIKKIAGNNSNIIIKKPGLSKEYTCDNEKLLEELGDFKLTDIDDALKEMYEWYISNKSSIKKEGLLNS